ncbi:MAG: YjbH domain-containing protein [Rhodocyclaceae bacterium]|nr:YjbH domain-containing protein [Rhodocyclaceae bacterium]
MLLAPCAASVLVPRAHAESATMGQTGLINMPDARVDPDGSFRIGISNVHPYRTGWMSLTGLPWLEFTGRYIRIDGVPGFGSLPQSATYGAYKDKAFGFKAVLLAEKDWLPQIAVGAQDVQGTGVFKANYGVASKRFGNLDLSVGVGAQRIDGLFAGARWKPERLANWAFTAEYDASDFSRDRGADLSGAANFKKGVNVGAEYRWGPLTTQLSYQHHELGVSAYLTIPTHKPEFVPKIDEPAPYRQVEPRPTRDEWERSSAVRARLIRALVEQDFRNVRLAYSGYTLKLALSNSRIAQTSRAVGRAARIALAFAPTDAREIEITNKVRNLPTLTYSFFDLPLLEKYFDGLAPKSRLSDVVAIKQSGRNTAVPEPDREQLLQAAAETGQPLALRYSDEGNFVELRGEDAEQNRFSITPQLSTFLNDPSGAFKFDLYAYASGERKIGEDLYLRGGMRYTLLESVSDVVQPSNSRLPHVRTDVAEYKRGGKFKLDNLTLSKLMHLGPGRYARLSAGIYEEMFAGVGGQWLHVWPGGDWAADVQVDWVKQRDFAGWFGMRDYSTVTGLLSVHHKLAMGLTGTVRTGRFLAKDNGARVEIARRFGSGMEFGVWYTYTDGKDTTSPGSPSSPYHDKGLFLSVPLNIMLTRDTQASAGYALAPWTRDVGQMVGAPMDLYALVERPLTRDRYFKRGLAQIGDVEDDPDLPSLGTSRWEQPILDLLANDVSGREAPGHLASMVEGAALGVGLTLASSSFDKRIDRFALQHGGGRWGRAVTKVGNALPLVALAGAAVASMDGRDTRLANVGMSALESAGLALLGNLALKDAIGRSRPAAGQGPKDFHSFTGGDWSMPSNHSSVMWAAVTPFAKDYDAPWLYGLALVTNAGRVLSRKHWFSDTVGGSVLGYGMGSLVWEWRRKDDMAVQLSTRGVSLRVPLD